MTRTNRMQAAVGIALCAAAALAVTQTCAAPRQQEQERPKLALALPATPPAGAVVLFGGKEADMANWVKRRSQDPAPWTVQNGVMTPTKVDLNTVEEFGDCYLHIEFRPTVDENGKTRGSGNAGVGMQGRYEIQMMDSFGAKPESHGCGSLYSQKPPLVNACKKAGEWQSYDIVFRAPRFDAEGKVTERARATIFQNGVLIHNNEEFTGPTGIQYEQFKGEAPTGPIVLQGDHDPVEFRNIWLVKL